jgi:hypothetical protein
VASGVAALIVRAKMSGKVSGKMKILNKKIIL